MNSIGIQTIFKGSFTCLEDVATSFAIPLLMLNDVGLLLANYSEYRDDGEAFVLYQQGGKLYEVHAEHCSCHGLENMWEPEETTVESLLFRLDARGDFGIESRRGGEDYRDELLAILYLLENSGGGVDVDSPGVVKRAG